MKKKNVVNLNRTLIKKKAPIPERKGGNLKERTNTKSRDNAQKQKKGKGHLPKSQA